MMRRPPVTLIWARTRFFAGRSRCRPKCAPELPIWSFWWPK